MRIGEDEFAISPAPIERQIPMHTSVFRPASEALLPHLSAAPWKKPSRPYLSNVLGGFVENTSPEMFVELLARHVYSPVRWRDQIDALAARFGDAVFIEVGPRGVLYNLLQKRWHNNKKFKTDSAEGFADHFRTLVNQLRSPERLHLGR
jgi:malonyl CoA-acyl carrier protein transacylase